MPVISIINYKGGVGKTTLTANLGAELAHRGKRVLLMDMDAQSSLTFSFVKPDFWQDNLADGGTILDWYRAHEKGSPRDLGELITKPAAVNRRIEAPGCLDLIPSHLGLLNVDLELASQLGGSTLKQSKLKYLNVHRRLADALGSGSFENYDVILIDCPPNFNIVTKNAIVASDQILIPAKPDYLSTLGIDYLRRSVDELVSEHNEYSSLDEADSDGDIDPRVLGVVFTMVQFYGQAPIQAQLNYIAQARRLKLPIFSNYLRENKSHFADAPEFGVPLVLNRGNAVAPLVAEVEQLVTEFQDRAAI